MDKDLKKNDESKMPGTYSKESKVVFKSSYFYDFIDQEGHAYTVI